MSYNFQYLVVLPPLKMWNWEPFSRNLCMIYINHQCICSPTVCYPDGNRSELRRAFSLFVAFLMFSMMIEPPAPSQEQLDILKKNFGHSQFKQ